MLWFLFFYILIYGGQHLIVWYKIRRAWQLQRGPMLVVGLFMTIMVFAPILIRMAERLGVQYGLHLGSFICFSWMGMIFLFLVLYLVVDATTLLRFFQVPPRRKETNRFLRRSRKKIFICILLITCSLFGYGLFEAADLKKKVISITDPRIPKGRDKIRIVQISDVHLGLLVGESKLKKIIATVRSFKPDLLVSTGDLVDGQPNNLAQAATIFQSLQPPLGKIAVTGNHEFYAGLNHSLHFTREAGFTVLRNQVLNVAGINIVGVDDKTAQREGLQVGRKEHDLFVSQSRDNFTLLLKHQPIIAPGSLGLFDLQLSGHTHKGQIFPFNLITYLFFPFPTARLVDLERGQLYISPGTATWGPPIRLFAPPEVTVFDLIPSTKKTD